MWTPNAILNFAWLAVSVSLALILYRLAPKTSRSRKVTALVLLAVSLFPIVSITDDFLRAANLSSLFNTRRNAGPSLPEGNSNESSSATQLQLIRALDTVEAALVSHRSSLEETFVAAEWTTPPAAHSSSRAPEAELGRAPPPTA